MSRGERVWWEVEDHPPRCNNVCVNILRVTPRLWLPCFSRLTDKKLLRLARPDLLPWLRQISRLFEQIEKNQKRYYRFHSGGLNNPGRRFCRNNGERTNIGQTKKLICRRFIWTITCCTPASMMLYRRLLHWSVNPSSAWSVTRSCKHRPLALLPFATKWRRCCPSHPGRCSLLGKLVCCW